MKDIYMKPETAVVIVDTCHICAGSPTLNWKVDEADVDDPENPHWGPIKPDKGENNMGSYDPWDSANW